MDLVVAAEIPDRLTEGTAAFRPLLLPPDRDRAGTERSATRPEPGTWSPLEYACHVRDVLAAAREFVYRVLLVERPEREPMGRDERVELARYADEDVAEVVDQLEVTGRMLARSYGVLPREAYRRTFVRGDEIKDLTWYGGHIAHELVHHHQDIAAVLAPHTLGLDHVRRSPATVGRVDLIAIRPAIDERTILDEGVLDERGGLVGDNWVDRPSSRTPDRSPNPTAQIAIMNSRAAALVAGTRDRWALAGDQLYVDLDLSEEALPPSTRLAIGDAIVEVTAEPHRGCAKFSARFGREALRLVNSAEGRALRLRGVNTKVVVGGTVRTGDEVRVL